MPIGALDVVGIISANEKTDCLKATLQILEHVLALAEEKGGHEITIIFDLDGFVLKNYAWRPGNLNSSNFNNKQEYEIQYTLIVLHSHRIGNLVTSILRSELSGNIENMLLN